MKVVFIERDKCLACRNCERVCSFQDTGGFRREYTNIWVHFDPANRYIFTTTCLQCEDAACLEVCPVGAVRREPGSGAVVVDESSCVGCKMCVDACPFGHMHFDNHRGFAVKCNLCHGDPQCVKNCMSGALHYADINELAEIKRRTARQAMLQSRARQKAGRS